MDFIGIDSVPIKQGSKEYPKKGLIGVGVEIKDYPKFVLHYQKILQNIFEKYSCEYQRQVYCSRDLIEIFEFDDIPSEIKVLEEIKEGLLPYIDKIYFFYTFLFAMREISVFGATPNYHKIPVCSNKKGEKDFYGLIESSYPLNCAWYIQQNNTKAKFLLDNFQGRISPSWDLLKKDSISIYYQGDRCNYLISSADLLVRLMKLKMYRQKDCFVLEGINRICSQEFGEKYELCFLGKKYLKQITPNETKKIHAQKLIAHPIYFISKENPLDSDETKSIENSPLFKKMIEKISSANGCFKYYEKGNDEKLMISEDYFIFIGEKGESNFKKLKKLGFKLNKFD